MKSESYAQSLVIAAPCARVFDALTTLEGLEGWWASRARGSNRSGGTIRLEFEGLDEHIDLKVLEQRKSLHLAWQVLEHTALPEWNGTTIRFKLDPHARGCALAFVHQGLTSTLDCFEDCRAGWVSFLSSLASFLAKGKGRPYRARTKRGRESFEDVVAVFAMDPRVRPPESSRGAFGSNGLKVDGKIFAMQVDRELVVKLPRERVCALIDAGEGRAYETSRGRVMREWIVVRGSWIERAREARRFVGGDCAGQ